jgi:hypothetical protein
MKPDKDGTLVPDTEIICNTMFWGLSRLWVDGASHIEFEMVTREGSRKFIVDSAVIGRGGREVNGVLASNEITGKGNALQSYLTGWLSHLSKTADRVMAHRSFGWDAEGDFVLGDAVIRPDGGESRSILMGMAKSRGEAVVRKGDLKTWVALVDRAYNAPGQEAFQFQIACAFAAPLLSLMQQVRGVTVYSHTDGSGAGKTTVHQVGLSAWGDWDALMLADKKTTPNMLWALMGAYRSLPVVYDELTNAPNADVSELVFSVSSGRAKERMTAGGEARTNNSNWSTILLASGNTLLSDKLAQHRANAEAEISRLFEFTLRADPHLSVVEANALFPQFANHYGHAGYAFARAVATNRDKVTAWLLKTQRSLISEFEMTQVERHWSALFAAVLVALVICRDQKLVAFDIAPIKAWMRDQLAENRGQRNAGVVDYKELLSQMLDELWADVLVTQGVGDLRTGTPVHTLKQPRTGSVIGRAVRATSVDKADVRISRVAIHKWCNAKGVSPKTMHETAVNLRWCAPEIERYGLGRGVKEYQTTDNIHCWKFYPDVMEGVVSVNLSLVSGGKP